MATIWGRRTYSLSRDSDGHREYKVKHLIKAALEDGPYVVLNTPGLPLPGAQWSYGNDFDPWAWCRPTATVQIHEEKEGDKTRWWVVEQTYSTKPPDQNKGGQRCNDTPVENPLLEPMKVSGDYTRYTKEAQYDRFGIPIRNSCHEPVLGPAVEFDESRPTITIEQNVADQQEGLLSLMINTVNGTVLWGLGYRTIKLSSVSWEKKFYGQCSVYYTRKLTFEVNYETWDRVLLDYGSKVLKGKWNKTTRQYELKSINGADPDPYNPTHFQRHRDPDGEVCKIPLNGAGLPAQVVLATNSRAICVFPNAGEPTYKRDYWLPLANSVDDDGIVQVADWVALTTYPPGHIVYLAATATYYVSLVRNSATSPDINPTEWLALTSGYSDAGIWSDAGTYFEGDIVRDLAETGVGTISIQKYRESNFLLLGIPLVL